MALPRQSTLPSLDSPVLYYRQKVLLALLEQFGGRLGRTDCQKLLFLFCKTTERNHYDFFPYQYGGFSFLSYRDKATLTGMGLLADTEDFQLGATVAYLPQLDRANDRAQLLAFTSEFADCRGNSLIREAYLRFPRYASRSTILARVLTRQEIARVKPWWSDDEAPCLFTIGYQDRSIDAYLDLLIAHNVRALVDVRDSPRSMKYGFSQARLRHYATSAGLQYYHLPGLGVPRHLRADLAGPEDYRQLFDRYTDDILPKRGDDLHQLRSVLARNSRVALTCFEKDPSACHRHCISDHMAATSGRQLDVTHL